jgi:hypothetical protein
MLDGSFEENTFKNIDSELNFVNGDYVYQIRMDLLPDLSYYVSFVLVEK